MDRLTFDELEERKKYLAARRDYLEMQSTVRKVYQLLVNLHAMMTDYYSEGSIRKGQSTCGTIFSFRRHRLSSEADSMRSSDLPFLVMNNILISLSWKLSKLEKIGFPEYSRHKKLIDGILFRVFDDEPVDLRDISPENPLYGGISPAYVSRLEEASASIPEEELLAGSVYDIVEKYHISSSGQPEGQE